MTNATPSGNWTGPNLDPDPPPGGLSWEVPGKSDPGTDGSAADKENQFADVYDGSSRAPEDDPLAAWRPEEDPYDVDEEDLRSYPLDAAGAQLGDPNDNPFLQMRIPRAPRVPGLPVQQFVEMPVDVNNQSEGAPPRERLLQPKITPMSTSLDPQIFDPDSFRSGRPGGVQAPGNDRPPIRPRFNRDDD